VLPKPVSASRLRTDLQLQGRFVVAYSGNLGRAHEFETMLAAATALREDPAFVFLMVGGGAKMGELHSRVTELGLENFRFLPYQSREMLSDSLAAADVHLACLLPELEGLIVPSKMYGILAAGRPAVFIGDTDGELARLLEESHCGVSVRCGDGALLAEELRRMQRDNERTRLMGLRARAVFETRFTLNRAVRKWIHLLSDVGMPLSSRAPQLDMPANEPDVVVTAVPGIARAGL
jgi:colanic acid biosynthesis glycosyl transferase WcaI